MTLHHSNVQRLSFVKYLYTLAIEQARLPEIQASASLLIFHDSIEVFLQIASEHLDAGKPQPNFMDYWDFLSPKIAGAALPQKESMRRLNKARTSLKHSGTFPSKLDIESFRASVTQFFVEAFPLIFNLEFSEISLIEYVSNDEVKLHLKNAIDFARKRDYETSMNEIALGYEKLIYTYTTGAGGNLAGSEFSFGRSMGFIPSVRLGLREQMDMGRVGKLFDATIKSIEELQSAVRILALGINYKKYVKFRSRLPSAVRMAGGNYVVQHMGRKDIDHDHVDFCIMFVVECAIRLDETSNVATND